MKKLKTYKDVYKFPLHLDSYCSWAWDSDDNFVFQFETKDRDFRLKVIETLNGNYSPENKNMFYHKEGYIYIKTQVPHIPVILIRGWGNLTGTGAMNLPLEEAENIQDTFAEFIVDKLNGI